MAERDGRTDKGLEPRNWWVIGAGIAIYIAGFFVLDAVRENHEGFLAFLAPFTILMGMIVVVAGTLLPSAKGG